MLNTTLKTQFIDTIISQDDKYIASKTIKFCLDFLSEIFKVRFHHGRLNVNQVCGLFTTIIVYNSVKINIPCADGN